MRKLAGTIPAILLLLALSAFTAQAQQALDVAINRASFIVNTPINPSGIYSFSGPGLAIDSRLQNGDGAISPQCFPCAAGEAVHVATNFTSYGYGHLTLNGYGANLYFVYSLYLQGPASILPRRFSQQPVFISGPAIITGVVRGHRLNPNVIYSPPVFEATVNLTGSVIVRLHPSGQNGNGTPLYWLDQLVYDFPQPVGSSEQKPH